MARIFISYARKHEAFARNLAASLSNVGASVWLDVEDIPAGMNWSSAIQEGLDFCDVMLVIITPESMASKNVENEWQYYLDEGKVVIPVLLEPAKVHFQIRRLQYVDFLAQNYDTAFVQLHSELRRKGVDLKPILADDHNVTLPVNPPLPEREDTVLEENVPPKPRTSLIVGGIGVVLAVILAIIALNSGIFNPPTVTDTPTSQVVAQITTAAPAATQEPTFTDAPTLTPMPELTQTPSDTPTVTQTPTDTLTPDIAAAAQTVIAEQTLQAIVDAATATSARATEDAVSTQTQADSETATATLWTDTPTPNYTASVSALLTEWANSTATQNVVNETATADTWTDTPTPTSTPSNTPTLTLTLTPDPLDLARTFSGGNRDWQPFATIFPDDPVGAEMMLVPVGEFMMGSENGYDDEKPVHKQVFDTPFWIDRTEVTRAMYAQCVAVGKCTTPPENQYSTRDRQPINRVTWFQASDFCEWRGVRLPTEREWEYAARGPDGWVYPWGDDFVVENVVYSSNSNNTTADVGSKEQGASWVGAVDMSGNVREWVSSIYQPYPYRVDDGRESNDDTSRTRVLRGGSFDDFGLLLRVASRYYNNPTLEDFNIGFRCARS